MLLSSLASATKCFIKLNSYVGSRALSFKRPLLSLGEEFCMWAWGYVCPQLWGQISRKPKELRGKLLLQIADTFLLGSYRKVAKGRRMVTSPMTSRDPMTSQSWHHNLQHAISSTVPYGISQYCNIINHLLHSASKRSTRIVDPGFVTSEVTSSLKNFQSSIAQKLSEIRVWSLLMTYRKSHILLGMVTWPMTSGVRMTSYWGRHTDPWRHRSCDHFLRNSVP